MHLNWGKFAQEGGVREISRAARSDPCEISQRRLERLVQGGIDEIGKYGVGVDNGQAGSAYYRDAARDDATT